jgi:hypothetical protein
MATTALSNILKDAEKQELVIRVIWAVFNAEKSHLHIRVGGFFSFDASGVVRDWLTQKFGPEPTTTMPLVTSGEATDHSEV